MNKSVNSHSQTRRSKNLKTAAIALLFFTGIFPLLFSFKDQTSSNYQEEVCRAIVVQNVSEIIEQLLESEKTLQTHATKSKKIRRLRSAYSRARVAYKEIEFFVEYYSAFDAKFYLNGPLVPKIEMEISSQPIPPHGFQVIEEALFDSEKADFEILQTEYRLLREKFVFLKEYYTSIHIEQSKVQDALKLQVIRIMCLTLNGYDCTINKATIQECNYALNGIRKLIASYLQSAGQEKVLRENYFLLEKILSDSKNYLKKHKDSDSFDRLSFTKDYLNPLYGTLITFFDATRKNESGLFYAVNFGERSFFEKRSINKQYFSVYVTDTFHLTEQAELGRFLFFDPVLSGNNQRACASCHKDNMAYADGVEKSMAFDKIEKLPRNVPTLINAAYQKLFFHDGRSFNMEGQANAVFRNVHEMNTNELEVVAKLKKSEQYRKLFFDAFKGTQDSAITPYAVLKCLSEFIKTLDSRNSRFDKYLRGESSQLTSEEKNGYNLFAGKALCGSCHFFPLFNGTVPPMYNDNEFEIIGTPEKMGVAKIDPDPGRKTIARSDIHDHAFKTPSLRNIEYTAPYMHNGVYQDLDSVLVFYNRGGGAGSGYHVQNQTLPFDSLGLSKKELSDIKKFLLTLSDTSGLPKAPRHLPEFKDAILDARKIGGAY